MLETCQPRELHSLIKEFLLDQAVRGNSRKTLDYYEISLKMFSSFFGSSITVDKITVTSCREYFLNLTKQSLSSVSVQSYVRALRAFLKWMYDNDYIEIDICQKFKLPKATRKVIDVLTDYEIRAVYIALAGDDLVSVRNKLIISLMLDSGLRLHEVVTLTVSSVHLTDRYLIVQQGKGNKQRVVPFGNVTANLIERYLKLTSFAPCRSPLIIKVSDFDSAEAVSDNTIKQMFRKLKQRSGVVRLHPHLLRHTFATRYLENGGNIYALQAILGHTSLEMVKRYLHLANSRIRRDFPQFSPLDNIKKDSLGVDCL